MKSKYLILGDGKSPHIFKWVKELIKYFDVYLISLNSVSDELQKILHNNIYVLNDKINSTGGNYKLIFKLHKIKQIIKNISPDYLNAHYLSSYGFLGALCVENVSNMKFIISTWGSDILVEPFLNLLRKKIAQFSLSKADFITSDSLYMTDTIYNLIRKRDNVITFPFGFNQIETNIKEKENIIFSNRALKDFYNIDKIIRWFSKQNKKYKLIIANDGVEKQKLVTLVKELNINDRVDFVGYLSSAEQKEIYKKSLYYISIPSSDSTSVSLLEAMMYGAFPIVSNIPANREWILDGINGMFFYNDLNLDTIVFNQNFYDINLSLLEKKAIFSKNIKKLVERIIE